MDAAEERVTWYPLAGAVVFLLLVIAASYAWVVAMFPPEKEKNLVFWYMERAAGFTAYELLAFTALLGLTSSAGMWDRWKARRLVTQWHQFASSLVIAFLVLHLWGLHEDTTIPFPWPKLFVPFAASYRPLFTGFGVLALYGLAVLLVTSYLRPHIRPRVWRSIHFLSIPVFLLVTLHGLLSGTDSASAWAVWMYVVPAALFVGLLVPRLLGRS
ncbi:MAG: ferric reductase-like transmembrane domain-containing protein [Alicyclobacillus macrosporangiidus]|uniref:ferric reductase-like transmembrane domain-containing protein n=1 Tax=Alicyclobacillus macrosporangiidus TaxID=392015 RepID=UPI0026EB02B4|nr:ferric reductase-like transmembrane domain-containing protein [Alicyclobacillus macrosporangiidus]MCL6600251.1 ferric reductase-like transmembrane domain-containing protein [Alicyclobacillus macrosporangiidus]